MLVWYLVCCNVGIWLLTGSFILKQFADQVRIRLILQLINSISRVLQKLLRYFNSTIILTSFVSPLPDLPNIFVLNLNEALLLLLAGKSMIALSSLKLVHLYNIATNFLMFFNNYCYVLSNETLTLIHQCLSHYLFEFCLFHLFN